MDKNINNQRKSNRIQTNINVVFSCDHFQYIGTATNCSESGMCINTPHYISSDSFIEIIFPLKEDELKLIGLLKRTVKRDNFQDAIGVELLNPSPHYSDFIKNSDILYKS